MAQTPPSLLNRLREHPGDTEAWHRFDGLYRPLIASWLRRHSIQEHDADDLLQEVFQTVMREMPTFRYDPDKGRFRGWLRAILANRLREFWRRRKARPLAGDSGFDKMLAELEDPRSDLSHLWDEEHDKHVAQRILALIEADFSPTTWTAFKRLMGGEKPTIVAADLGISVNAVYLAKSGILKRLRNEMQGLTE